MEKIFNCMRDGEQRSVAQQPVPSSAATDIARKVLRDGFKDRVPLSSRPCLGIILGTGMGSLVNHLEEKRSIDFSEIGWLPSATAIGHAGRLVWGHVDNHSVVMLQGRAHAYEGLPIDMLYRGVELFAALGVERVLLTNASGGLTSDLVVGEIVVLNDHIDFVRKTLPEEYLKTIDAHIYDELLSTEAVHAAKAAGHHCRRGVYAYCLGPNYETRAEYRMLKMLDADVVGMSTVPEAIVARGFGMRVVAASVVTNLTDSVDSEDWHPLDGEDVCQAAASATNGMWTIVRQLLSEI